MRRLLIVEDERWEREGLVDFIDWSGFGIGEVLSAENGAKGLETARKLPPDIVITDIKMPKMDGAALGAALREILPECLVIIVSGYDDSAYARQAVAFGAFDYLLKPLRKEDLLEVMERAVGVLESRRSRLEGELELRDRLAEGRDAEMERLLRAVAAGRGPGEEGLRLARRLNATLFRRGIVAAAMKLDLSGYIGGADGRAWKDRIDAAHRCARKAVGERGIVARGGDRLGEILICLASEGRQAAAQAIGRVLAGCGSLGRADITVGIGDPRERLEDFPPSYREASAALDRLFLEDEASVAFFSDIPASEERRSPSWAELQEALLRRISSPAAGPDPLAADEAFGFLRSGSLDRAGIRAHVSGMLGKLALSVGGDAALLARHTLAGAEITETMECFARLGGMQDWLLGIARSAMERIKEKAGSRERRIAESAMDIIRKEYFRNIGIGTVADRLGVSPNYLGALFRQRAGKSFTEALTELRMAKADELLDSGAMSVGAVAKAVGYGSPGYFASVYRKRRGASPLGRMAGRGAEAGSDGRDA